MYRIKVVTATTPAKVHFPRAFRTRRSSIRYCYHYMNKLHQQTPSDSAGVPYYFSYIRTGDMSFRVYRAANPVCTITVEAVNA
jgi:hypothetical protein